MKKNQLKIQKAYNKLWYVYFKLFVFLYGLWVRLLIVASPILKKKNKKHQLHLFPYSQKGSDGYTRRFQEFFVFLERDHIRYKMHDICSDQEYKKAFRGKKSSYYLFLLKVYRIRIKQTFQIRHAEKAFVHRNLFPFYYDQKNPLLEKLASKLCNEVVYDYWDSVWIHNEELNRRTVEIASTISVANKFLFDYFSKFHSNVKYFNIGINLNKYIPKSDYNLCENELKLFYTGSPSNVKHMLGQIGQYLVKISKTVKIKLIVVSSEPAIFPGLDIKQHAFNENTFFKLLNSADAGIYALKDSIATRGKMAMKIMDYSGTGLPILATKYGVSPHLYHGENVLFCDSDENWINNVSLIYSDKKLREKLGKKSRLMVENYHSLDYSYNEFKLLFSSL